MSSYAATPDKAGTPKGLDPSPLGGSPTGSDSHIVKEEGAPVANAQGSKWKKLAIGAGVVVVLVLVVALPVYFTVGKKNSSGNGGSSGGGGGGNGGGDLPVAQPGGVTSGGDGSTVVTEDGTSFTYKNKFGGYWMYDPARPFANGVYTRFSWRLGICYSYERAKLTFF